MTTTAMMKTKLAVMDPTMSGNCSCHGFVGSALRKKERKWLKEQTFKMNLCIYNKYKLDQPVMLYRACCLFLITNIIKV